MLRSLSTEQARPMGPGVVLTGTILAGMPNMSKVPTLEEWKALLQDEMEKAGVPAAGTPPHPPEGQMTGSHTSVVTSSSGLQKAIRAGMKLEMKAREPLPRSSQPGGNVDRKKNAGGPTGSTQGTNSNVQNLEEAQKAHDSSEKGTTPPSALGTANPQSPSTICQYALPKGLILQLSILSRHSISPLSVHF
jgi:hypothetical protein